jgi:hypothetical protein
MATQIRWPGWICVRSKARVGAAGMPVFILSGRRSFAGDETTTVDRPHHPQRSIHCACVM